MVYCPNFFFCCCVKYHVQKQLILSEGQSPCWEGRHGLVVVAGSWLIIFPLYDGMKENGPHRPIGSGTARMYGLVEGSVSLWRQASWSMFKLHPVWHVSSKNSLSFSSTGIIFSSFLLFMLQIPAFYRCRICDHIVNPEIVLFTEKKKLFLGVVWLSP